MHHSELSLATWMTVSAANVESFNAFLQFCPWRRGRGVELVEGRWRACDRCRGPRSLLLNRVLRSPLTQAPDIVNRLISSALDSRRAARSILPVSLPSANRIPITSGTPTPVGPRITPNALYTLTLPMRLAPLRRACRRVERPVRYLPPSITPVTIIDANVMASKAVSAA